MNAKNAGTRPVQTPEQAPTGEQAGLSPQLQPTLAKPAVSPRKSDTAGTAGKVVGGFVKTEGVQVAAGILQGTSGGFEAVQWG